MSPRSSSEAMGARKPNRTPDNPPQGLPFWDPRKVLERPSVYNFFQRAVGADRPRRQFIAEHVAPLGSVRVLEVGCGPGTNCAWMPTSIEYVGCDLNEAYITYARRVYGDRYQFFPAPVGELGALGLKPFKAIIALALLHHLNDAEILTLCDEVAPLLEAGGIFMTGDPCFTSDQTRLERFLRSCDRGRYMRYPEEYRALLATKFPVVEMEVIRNRGMMMITDCGVLLKSHGG